MMNPDRLSEWIQGVGLSDGQWHSVELSFGADGVRLSVDGAEDSRAHGRAPLQPPPAERDLFFGGCPAEGGGRDCRNPFTVFQGCMRLLTLDKRPVDLIKVQQRLLGNYSHLQIDMCGITDRMRRESRFVEPSSRAHGGARRKRRLWDGDGGKVMDSSAAAASD
ncbi:unnamed protein product [Arctogadus glacialis]